MAESINEVGDDLSTRARMPEQNFAMLQCSWCEVEAFPADPAQVAKLVEHCTYDHNGHVAIIGVKYDVFIEGYDLAARLGAPALTEHEQQWRQMQECGHNDTSLMPDGRLVKCNECGKVFQP